MKVLMLTTTPYPQDGRIEREVRALTAAGHRVTVVCSILPSVDQGPIPAGVKVLRFRNRFFGRYGARIGTSARGGSARRSRAAKGPLAYVIGWGLSTVTVIAMSLRALRNPGFDIVHVHNPPDTLAVAAAIYKPFGKRLVFDHHDLAPEMYDARSGGVGNTSVRRLLVWLERLACRIADHVLAANESYKAVEIARHGVPEDRITVVRNGPDLDVLSRAEPDPALASRHEIVIGYVGVMNRQDGVDHLLRALAELIVELGRKDVLCLLIGAGDAFDELRELAEELGIANHVKFTGWLSRPNASRALAAVDIAVEPAPSNDYNDRSTMVKIMEYMALGKAIVAYDLPENRYTAGDAALFVEPNDESQLAQAVAALMDDADRRRRMGEVGRRRIGEVLDWRYSAERLVAAYEGLSPR